MQAVTCLSLEVFLFPMIWPSGPACLCDGLWSQGAVTNAALEGVALAHAAAAFAVLVFIILHILPTTGYSLIGHLRPMTDGQDDVEPGPAEAAFLEADEPGRIR